MFDYSPNWGVSGVYASSHTKLNLQVFKYNFYKKHFTPFNFIT